MKICISSTTVKVQINFRFISLFVPTWKLEMYEQIKLDEYLAAVKLLKYGKKVTLVEAKLLFDTKYKHLLPRFNKKPLLS